MHIRQMAAERTGLHHFPIPGALNVPRIPIGSGDTYSLQSPVRFSRELDSNPTRGADHRLHLGRVRLTPPSQTGSRECPVPIAGIPCPSMQGTRRRRRRLQRSFVKIKSTDDLIVVGDYNNDDIDYK